VVARWHTHLLGLATAIHEISGLGLKTITDGIARFFPQSGMDMDN
jgi:hypothetical protein